MTTTRPYATGRTHDARSLDAPPIVRDAGRHNPSRYERRFTNALSGRVVVWMVAPFLLGAIVAGLQAGWIVGAGIAVAGIGLAVVMRTCRSVETLIVDETGLTRVIGRTPHRASTHTFRWDDVHATRYAERTLSAGANDHTLGVFTVHSASGPVLEVTQHWRSFAAIVAVCNQRTPHLGYSWEPSQEAPAGDILERSGAYCRTARLTAHYSHMTRRGQG